MTDEKWSEIAARVDKAAPGPWGVDENSNPRMIHSTVVLWKDDSGVDCLPSWVCNAGSFYTEEDKGKVDGTAEFIAASRQDIPELLAEVKRLRLALEAAPHEGTCYSLFEFHHFRQFSDYFRAHGTCSICGNLPNHPRHTIPIDSSKRPLCDCRKAKL